MGLMGDGQNNYYDQRRRHGPVSFLIGGVLSLMTGRQSNPHDQRRMDTQRPRDGDPRASEIQRDGRDVPARQNPSQQESKTKDDMFGNRTHGDDESDHDDRAEREYERHIRNIVAQQSQEQQFAPPPGPPPSYQAAIRGS